MDIDIDIGHRDRHFSIIIIILLFPTVSVTSQRKHISSFIVRIHFLIFVCSTSTIQYEPAPYVVAHGSGPVSINRIRILNINVFGSSVE